MNSQKEKSEKQPFMQLLKKHKKKSIGAGLSAIGLSVLSFSLAFAKEPNINGLKEIYHVYNGEQYVGAVASKSTIDTLIDMKKEEASIQYKELSVDAGSNIQVVPEQVYTVAIDEEETLTQLEQSVEIEAKAHSFVIAGEAVAYLKDKEDFEKTVNLLKLKFVSQEQLDKLNASDTNNVPLSADNQTRVVAVGFLEEVSTEETLVKPDKILTPEQAAEFLASGSLQQQTYQVQQGDVLGSIAKKHGLKLADLLAINPGITDTTILKIGQELNVTVTKPYVNISVATEAYSKVIVPFTVIEEQDPNMLKGETKIVQEGADGEAEQVHSITIVNGVETGRTLLSENILKEKVDKKVIVGTKVIPDRGTGAFAWPAVGGYVSSQMGPRWGRNHDGIDIARPSNRTIKASDNGRVTFTGWDGTYGQKVVINHNNGYETVYAHLASITVSVGDVVEQGQQIGVMGSTGRSTGIHLHFEVKHNGSLVNPMSVLN